jgi:predicted nucleic acid-binding protein
MPVQLGYRKEPEWLFHDRVNRTSRWRRTAVIDADVRDLDDIPIVAFSLAMKADFMITGDHD